MLTMRTARVGIPDRAAAAFKVFVQGLQPHYRALVASTRQLHGTILGVPVLPARDGRTAPRFLALTGPRDAIREAEIGTDGSDVFVLTINEIQSGFVLAAGGSPQPETRLELRLQFLSPHADARSYEQLKDRINQAFEVSLADDSEPGSRFRELLAEGRTPTGPIPGEQVAGARILSNRHNRTVAVAIKSSAGLLVSELPKHLGKNASVSPEEVKEGLATAGLITSEWVLVCKKTQSEILRAPSSHLLNSLAQPGVRCGCGQNMQDERRDEVLTITELGRTLLDGSHWLSILVVDEFVELGIPRDHILVDQQHGGDETDCLVDINGDLAFLELKDKMFSLGNAYPFGAKLPIIQARHSIIVTTDQVGNDVKRHFEAARAGEKKARASFVFYEEDDRQGAIRYVEGVENLSPAIASLITEINQRNARLLLTEVLAFASPSPDSVLSAVRIKVATDDDKSAAEPIAAPAPRGARKPRTDAGTN